MLPWLVIPLVGLWLLSQFLPPAFRFEITSPRLACVLVLLVTLFWYEILMPQLSSWRARRNDRLKEKKRLEAIEMHKLKKNAIRKCRNCRTPYRDQNPSGGKFNCSYCGHVSKRPLFDPSVSPGLDRFSNSGNLKDLVGRLWSENNWICGQDWLETGGNYVNGPLSGKSSYWKNNSGGFFNSGNDHFFSFLLVFVCKSLAASFLGIMWLFRKLFRISFSEDDTSPDSDIVGLAKKGENGVNCNETRSEKARRKTEEKRQARLEREQLEEEERKQREEVARLVKERRKLRDENDRRDKVSPRVKNDKKETGKKRQERNKEQDRGSIKSSSDVDELEKRACKEIERNKKAETDCREHHKSGNENVFRSNNYNKGSVGARYLDRMRGNFFPSSTTVTGGGLFGKHTNVNAYTSNTREGRSSASLDHATKRDVVQPECAHRKSNAHANDQNLNRPAHFEPQPCPPLKRSWQQLFTRSSPTASSTSTNVISRPNGKSQTEVQSSIASGVPIIQGFDTPISVGLPFSISNFSFGNSTSSTCFQLSSNPTELLPEEPDNFEQRCYDPDPTSLIGPVSESLDNFQLDLGFVPDLGFKKPSPFESSVSRLWNSDEKNSSSFFFSGTQPKTNLPMEDKSTTNEKGWQMWNSSPICPDTFGLVCGNPTWYLPRRTQEKTKLPLEDHVLPISNGFVHATSDDPWGLRTSYGSMSTSNNSLSLNQQSGTTHNELVYGIPNGSSINHPFQPYHGSVWAKKEKVASPVCAKGVGTTSATIAPSGGLYSHSEVQSLWPYD